MGTEALWIPAVMAAVGTGIQAKESSDTAKEQDEIAAQNVRTQGEKQREANARVSEEITSLQNSSPEASQKAATDAFMEQLNATRAQAQGGETVGAVSDAYNTDSAKASADIDQYGQTKAGVLGRISAAGRQRQDEAISANRASTDLGLIASKAAGEDFLGQLRLSQAQNNPWTMAAGQAISGAGSGMASSGGGTTGKVQKGGTSYGGTYTGSTKGFA